MTKAHLGIRSRIAIIAIRTTNWLSRVLRLGSGSTIGGRVGMIIDPHILGTLAAGRQIVIVSGTNGKTTTTALIAAAIGEPNAVASSTTGANLPSGVVGALAAADRFARAVLEVDESYVPQLQVASGAEMIVLLNLSRDQLDRVGEVRMVASKWASFLKDFSGTVVANADDPLVAWAALHAPRHDFVAAGGIWRDDSHHCPQCDATITFAPTTPDEKTPAPPGPQWQCSRCDLSQPTPVARLVNSGVELASGEKIELALRIPGRFNRANAAIALIAAVQLGVAPLVAAERMNHVSEVAGRFATVRIESTPVRLLLAKNPAGWAEILAELSNAGASSDTGAIVVSINSKIADGRDPSWLWDVPFEQLKGRSVIACGQRANDLGVRLKHGGVAHVVIPDLATAISHAGSTTSETIDFIGNYTPFQELRRLASRPLPTQRRDAERHLDTSHAPPIAKDIDKLGNGSASQYFPSLPTADSLFGQGSSGIDRSSKLQIAVVHPDLLGTYGDGGNALVLANRAIWHGIDAEVILAPSDKPLPESCDIYCLGGGEDGPQIRSAELLRSGALQRVLQMGAFVFAVCAGFQILGESFIGPDGVTIGGLGLLDVHTTRGTSSRAVGEIIAEPLDNSIELLTGFENHAGHTILGPDATPLARVQHGVGNDGSGVEGAVASQIIGTYLHGPVLARNPSLADHILALTARPGLVHFPDSPGVTRTTDFEENELRADRIRQTRYRRH